MERQIKIPVSRYLSTSRQMAQKASMINMSPNTPVVWSCLRVFSCDPSHCYSFFFIYVSPCLLLMTFPFTLCQCCYTVVVIRCKLCKTTAIFFSIKPLLSYRILARGMLRLFLCPTIKWLGHIVLPLSFIPSFRTQFPLIISVMHGDIQKKFGT